ncbi:DNA primase family protein [Phaeovulum sp.]|uniref:DNA primase family protein n=1 Tax=Phaeovulum sp. TaxID=2934796 RepID=UPI0039E520A6
MQEVTKFHNKDIMIRWKDLSRSKLYNDTISQLRNFKPPITHDAVAKWMTTLFPHTLKSVPNEGFRIYREGGVVWETLSRTGVLQLVRECCDFILKHCIHDSELLEQAEKKFGDVQFIEKVERALQIQRHIVHESHEWDAAPEDGSIPFAYDGGGVLFVEATETRERAEGDGILEPTGGTVWEREWLEPGRSAWTEYLTQKAGCQRAGDIVYNVRDILSPSPLWKNLLNHITGDDAEKIAFLKRWAGYCATNSIKEHKFLVIWGQSGTGKSTFGKVLCDVLGDYAIIYDQSNLMVRDYEKHNTYNRMLKGKRFALVDEVKPDAKWDTAKINKLVAGGGMEGQKMYKDPEMFTPVAKVMFSLNGLPQYDSPVGIDRRLILMGVNRKVEKDNIDKDLPAKLVEEYPHILEWILEGMEEYLNEGLGIPGSICRETDAFLATGDSFSAWWTACVRQVDGERTKVSVLRESYKAYCHSIGEKPKETRPFNTEIKMKGIEQTRNRAEWLGVTVCTV